MTENWVTNERKKGQLHTHSHTHMLTRAHSPRPATPTTLRFSRMAGLRTRRITEQSRTIDAQKHLTGKMTADTTPLQGRRGEKGRQRKEGRGGWREGKTDTKCALVAGGTLHRDEDVKRASERGTRRERMAVEATRTATRTCDEPRVLRSAGPPDGVVNFTQPTGPGRPRPRRGRRDTVREP